MGSYELDNQKYLHYTGDGWITTIKPLTNKQIKDFINKKLDYNKLKWRGN